MAEADVKTAGRLLDKPWLKRTSLYFVEYGLLLVVLTIVLWLFDALIFNIFGYLANGKANMIERATSVSALAATFVFVPAALVLWRRVRSEESLRPNVWLRKAHRFPLYVFVIIQALSALLLGYIVINGLITSIVAGFDDFGKILLTVVLPGLFGLAVHSLATKTFLGKTPRFEANFVLLLSVGMVVAALIMMLVLAVNNDKQTQTEQSPFDSSQDFFKDNNRSEQNFFDYY